MKRPGQSPESDWLSFTIDITGGMKDEKETSLQNTFHSDGSRPALQLRNRRGKGRTADSRHADGKSIKRGCRAGTLSESGTGDYGACLLSVVK